MSEILQTLGPLWQSMNSEERATWTVIASRKKTSCYAEFTRFNVRLMTSGREPVKSPF